MAYMEFPGVGYTEKDWDGSSAIEGGATDICGVMIIAQKGPVNKPVLVNSIEQAQEIFGTYMESAYGMYTIKGFFQNGGRSLYVSRLAHYSDITDASSITAKTAKVSVNDRRESNSEPTLTFEATSVGSLGNTYGIKIVDTHRVNTVLNNSANTGNKEIVCKIVRDFVVGDWIVISDETNKNYAQIVAIDTTERKLTLDKELANNFNVDSSKVTTCDFTLQTYKKSVSGPVLEKEFIGCNMDTKSPYYVESLVNSSSSGSSLLTCLDEHIEVDYVYEQLPVISKDVIYLTDGDDAMSDFCDTDIIGDASSKTGLYAFDDIHEMIHVYCPESHSKNVIRAGYDYWTSKMTGMYFSMVPSGLNPEESAKFRDEAGWNTSYGTLYHNWGYVTDPIGVGENPEKLVPLTGHVLGCMSKHDRTDVDLYGSAPAGESCILIGVNRLEFEVNDSNGGIMYGNKDRNINPIVNLSGNGGIAVWGARTQSTDKKWRWIHARRIFIYAETTIVRNTRWIAFKNKNSSLYAQIQRRVNKFLGTLKGLKGDLPTDRYEFVCDSTINDPDDPYVIGRIGLNIVSIGEFVWFEFGQKPEGVSLSEI